MFEDMTIEEMLNEIIEKKGAYSQNHIQHAENVIERASKYATEIKKRLYK